MGCYFPLQGIFLIQGLNPCLLFGDFPGGSVVKNPSVIQETWVQSLGWQDSLEMEMATHSIILAWEILWKEEPGGLQSMGLQKSQT